MKRRLSTLAILLSMSAAPAISAKPCPEAMLAELGYGNCNIEQYPIPITHDVAFLQNGQIIYKKWLGLDTPGTAVKLELLNADGSVSDRPFQFEREDFCQSFSNKTQTTLDTEYYGAALDGEWENARQFLVAVGAEYGFAHSYYRLDENMKIIGYSDQSKSTDLGLLADMRSLTDGTLRLTFSDGFEKKLSIVTLKLGAE